MNKTMRVTGLILFVSGFLLFNLLFFIESYRLTEADARNQIQDNRKAALFLQHAQPIIGVTYRSQFEFVRELDHIFTEVNEAVHSTYAVTEKDIDELIALNEGKPFDLRSIDSVFSDPISAKQFKDYASWLENSTLGSPEIRNRLSDIQANINRYGIVDPFGFNRYAVKDLKYLLTKDASKGLVSEQPLAFLLLTLGLCIGGALLYLFPEVKTEPGIKNDGVFFSPMKNRGWLGIVTGTWLILFYITLYFYPFYMTTWILLVDPVSWFLSNQEASRFFLYGFIYTLCILVMGVRMLIRYRSNRYQILRTCSVMFFQLAFAFIIPEILISLQKPYYDFKNIWPLDYDFFFDSELTTLIHNGTLGWFMLIWGIALIIVAVPVFTYFYGKRWYCSWVCGCGGLAETLGDPYRQLSDKSLRAWRIERWMVHGVLVFAVVMTASVLYTFFTGSSWFFFVDSYSLRETYGILIGAGFAGVVGTGFYPLMGNRVWCRFGCPLAAYLGLIQRFKSRFRITTNGGQCISCGNCSTYCEMGIDVRWYAQRGQHIVRSSCVGCGICSAVCPRGVLKLEVKNEKGRFGEPVLTGNNLK